MLSLANAALGEKDAAFKEAGRAVALLPSAKDRMYGPGFEENLALIQTMFGANSQAISTLARLLQTPYYSWFYSRTAVTTPALLRLDPLWIRCAAIPLSKNSARKSSIEYFPVPRGARAARALTDSRRVTQNCAVL